MNKNNKIMNFEQNRDPLDALNIGGNPKQVLERYMEKFNFSYDNFIDIEYSNLTQKQINELKERLGPWEEVDSYGGEDQGSSYWAVIYFERFDYYLKFDGYYNSDDGGTYDEMFEVKPKKVQKIFWE